MKQKLIFALIMGMITTAIISFVLIAVNAGLNEKFLMRWLRSWPISFVLAVLSILYIAPGVQSLIDRHHNKTSDQQKLKKKA